MNNTTVLSIPIKSIIANKNSRKTMDDAKFESLKESIRTRGLLQPIYVQDLGNGKYSLVAGFRRFRACKSIGKTQIMAVISDDANASEASIDNLVENLIREDLPVIEEAEAMRDIMGSEGYTQTELAEKLNVSPAYISQRLKLIENASETLKEAVAEGTINNTSAIELADLPEEEQEEVIEKIEKQQAAGKKVRTVDVQAEVAKRKKKEEDPDLSELASDLKEQLKGGVLRTKNEVINEAIRLSTKFYSESRDVTKEVYKSQIALLEWVLSLREEI